MLQLQKDIENQQLTEVLFYRWKKEKPGHSARLFQLKKLTTEAIKNRYSLFSVI